MFESPLFRAMQCLDLDQRIVILAYYWSGKTEREIAEGLTELHGVIVGRDRVHRIRLTAQDKLRRALESLVEVAA